MSSDSNAYPLIFREHRQAERDIPQGSLLTRRLEETKFETLGPSRAGIDLALGGLKPGAVESCTVTTVQIGTGQIPRRTRWFSG
jgi:hypothetical protein